MGLSASKKVKKTLISSPDFAAACELTFTACLADSLHEFAGVKPYQLAGAAARLHRHLSLSLPLVRRWAPSPPPRQNIDAAIRSAMIRSSAADFLSLPEFEDFAAELFGAAVVAGAGGEVRRRIGVGAVGVLGAGGLRGSGVGVLVGVLGVYSVGVSAAVYFSLG